MADIRRIFVEKKAGNDVEARALTRDLITNLGIQGLEGVRVLQRYDLEGLTCEELETALPTVLSDPPVDTVYYEELPVNQNDRLFAIEYLPGQFDQRADSAAQCIQILTHRERPRIQTARVIVLNGEISDGAFQAVKDYCINPVDSRQADLEKPTTLERLVKTPGEVHIFDGFRDYDQTSLKELLKDLGLAMSLEDLCFCQTYFREEGRDPSLTEIKMLDTYWSDHCRHTTFLTHLKGVEIEDHPGTRDLKQAFESYLESRKAVYGDREKPLCLMDIATLAMKELRKQGRLEDVEVSEEINACSMSVQVDVDGEPQEWLVMFKNETHNHPTEIEPFGGAATCLGGAIRDPLSGRSYVYQAMRVTGCADPRQPIDQTLPGKLPQRKITLEAAHGYSSYGNQIGLATGIVSEVYHPGYMAKRMEVGAVIAAAPRKQVIREAPQPGDVVLLVGGKTGRDGIGGATGSSKEHTEKALENSSEVQKGDAPTERKLQRLFRNKAVAEMIKRCNDFGAGGVSVAIGELTDGLEIDLDKVPLKYAGLDGTELALSESQERMAVVLDAKDEGAFKSFSEEENLEAVRVATVTADKRLKMFWRGNTIVDLSREFLDSNGVPQEAAIRVSVQEEPNEWFAPKRKGTDLNQKWMQVLQDLNVCSQYGLVERFDSTIGAGSINHPFGGIHQSSPVECMVAKVPVLGAETKTVTFMSHGVNPRIATWNPFYGGLIAVVESVARIVASGGNHRTIRLTLQEYFEKLGKDPQRWGKPFSALLGAFWAQKQLGIPAIGGKDSMSGTFKDLNVPPTLVSFAVTHGQAEHVLSTELREAGKQIYWLKLKRNDQGVPDLKDLDRQYALFHESVLEGQIDSAHSVRGGGISEALTKMCFGNRIGFKAEEGLGEDIWFYANYGDLIFAADRVPENLEVVKLGQTIGTPKLEVEGTSMDLIGLEEAWTNPLESVFRTKTRTLGDAKQDLFAKPDGQFGKAPHVREADRAKPKVLIPVFPGTNCEYDSARAFEKAGARAQTLVFKNLKGAWVEESLKALSEGLKSSQILMIPGGFSAGDEPDGSGKFIASVFRNPEVADSVMDLLKQRDGLILGICNGFQALVKLGLLPYGEIREIKEDDPTLTFNQIGRHVSCYVRTRVVSNLSPWLAGQEPGKFHTLPVSNGEGRFVAPSFWLDRLFEQGQVATQYVDMEGNPTCARPFNPSNSMAGIEGITSPDGRVFGKMGHSERKGDFIGRNIPGDKDQGIFEAGVCFFK